MESNCQASARAARIWATRAAWRRPDSRNCTLIQKPTCSSSRMARSVPVTWSMRSRSAARSPLARTSESTGTKASEKEPSANRRRMKLGILNARKKASVALFAPK